MFVLRKQWTVRWPVKVRVPGSDADQEFTAVFQMAALDRIMAASAAAGAGAPAAAALQRAQWFWGDGGVDDSAAPIAFTPEARDQMLNIPFVRQAVTAAFIACMQGRAASSQAET